MSKKGKKKGKKRSKKRAAKPKAKAKPKAPAKPKVPAKPAKAGKRMSGLDAAAKVLDEAKAPMGCKAIAEKVLAKKYWQTGGKTPWATLNAAMLREIKAKGSAARFRKAGRGKFTLAK